MFQVKTDAETVRDNLRDAGCPDDFIERFLLLWEHGSPQEQLRLLHSQRCHLLDCVHAEQRKLDCLDHLCYQIKKQASGSK